MVNALSLSEMYCPFPSIPHPDPDEVEDRVIDWMRRFDYVSDAADEQAARHSGIARVGAWAAPYADVDGAALVAKWMVWLFIADDLQVERPAEIGQPEIFAHDVLRCMRVYHQDHMPENAEPHLHALAELRAELGRVAGHEVILRIGDGLNDYWLACACEIMFHTRGIVPPPDEYDRVRESLMLMRPTSMVLSALVQDSDLPTSIWSQPQIQAAARSASRIIGYTHDYHAGPREVRWPGSICFINVLAQHQGCDHQEALDRLNARNTAETQHFQRLTADLRNDGDPAVDRYLTSLERWIRGNYDWSRECGRYHISDPTAYTPRRGPFGV